MTISVTNYVNSPKTKKFAILGATIGMAFLSAFISSGCNLIPGLSNSIDRAVDVLDDGILELGNASTNWQIVLQDILSQLTDDAQATIRNEITELVDRSIIGIGVEARCGADFLRSRVRQDLIRIKTDIIGGTPPDKEPVFCHVLPKGGVDVADVPRPVDVVEIFGYDFDTDLLKVILVNDTTEVDVTRHLSKPTHYNMDLNLSGNGVQFTPGSNRFIISWQGRNLYSIAIKQSGPPPCETKEAFIRAAPLTEFIPPRTRGDSEFDGHGPRVRISVELLNRLTHIDALITMTAEETSSDWTTASGAQIQNVYPAPPNFRIENFVSAPSHFVEYIDTDHAVDEKYGSPGGPVLKYEIVGDSGSGQDAGFRTGVIVTMRQVPVNLKQVGNCS